MDAFVTRQPIRIASDSPDEDGFLILADDRLVAIIMRDETARGTDKGKWILAASFSHDALKVDHSFFGTADDAEAWIRHRIMN